MAKSKNTIGSWAFLAGVVLALVLGVFMQNQISNPTIVLVLVVIGFVVGILNVTGEETQSFLLSGAVLIIASSLGAGALGGISILEGTMAALLMIFVPATIIVAIKNVFTLARN
ncbi:MAG: hypothetical protein AABX88_03330 [Nanoarchaeota archaeon]